MMNEIPKIEELLQDFEMVNPELATVLREVRDMVLMIAPDCEEKIMYGGLIYATPGRMFCGLFLRKQHVSLEFDRGDLMTDRDGLLEGGGKFRRHLKIRSQEEIATKRAEAFVRQSHELKP